MRNARINFPVPREKVSLNRLKISIDEKPQNNSNCLLTNNLFKIKNKINPKYNEPIIPTLKDILKLTMCGATQIT